MQRNFKKIAIAGILAGLLIIGLATTAVFAAGNPYQDFENAALQTVLVKNMAANADFTITEDGMVILSGTVSGKLDGENQYFIGNITADGQTIDMETSRVDGNAICKIGDQYTSFNRQDKKNSGQNKNNDVEKFTANSTQVKLAKMAVDALVGDVKTYFTASGNKISVNLEGAQVPDIVNVALAAVTDKSPIGRIREKGFSDNMMTSMNGMKDLGEIGGNIIENLLKSLSDMQNLQVTSGSMDATLNNGYIDSAIINVTVAGKDSAGVSHTMTFAANVSLSSIGTTTVNAIDTTGKNVTEISPKLSLPCGLNNDNENEND